MNRTTAYRRSACPRVSSFTESLDFGDKFGVGVAGSVGELRKDALEDYA